MGQDDCDGKIPVFHDLGIFDNVTLSIPERHCDVRIGNRFYSLPHGHDNVETYLISKFPDEANGIKKYFKILRCYAKGYRRFPFELSYWEFLFFPIINFKNFILPCI